MDDHALRELVREAIAQHLGGGAQQRPAAPAGGSPHPSQGRFRVLAGGQIEGPCLIEPAVPCNHCGYCQSLGH